MSSYHFDPNFSLPSVDGGERAVIFDRFWGDLLQVVGEVTHFLISWVQRPIIIFSVRSKPCRIPVIPGSKGTGYKYCGILKCVIRSVDSQKLAARIHNAFVSNLIPSSLCDYYLYSGRVIPG